ncbi:MAG: PAS domain S-box protein, partial [Methanomicrobiales archaeon]
MFENSVVGLFQTAPGGRIINVNNAFAHMYGFSDAAEMLAADLDVGSPPYANPEDRQKVLHILAEKGRVENYEAPHLKLDGTRFWVSITARTIRNTEGNVLLYEGIIIDITERKRAEEAFVESELFNRGLVENLPEYIIVYGPDGKILYVNPATEMALGYNAKELVGTSVLSHIAEEHREEVILRIKLRQEGREVPAYEVDIVAHDGHRRPVIVKGTPIRYPDSPAFLILLVDITERKRVEAALSESFAIFKTVMDSLDALVYVADMKTCEILFINQYGRKIWGDLTGKICWESLQVNQKGPCPFCTNEKLVGVDGNPTGILIWEFKNTITGQWFECHDSAIRWTDGSIVRIEIATDITDRKRTEEALIVSEERYRNVIEDQTEFICRFLPDGTHIFVNDAYCRYFNKKREEIIGNRFRPILHPEDREIVAHHIASITPEHPVIDIDQRIIMPDGSTRWQRWSDRAIFDPDGRVVEYQSVGRDITEQKVAEEALALA